MLYIFVGAQAKSRVHTIFESLIARAPHAAVTTLSAHDPIDPTTLLESQGLFHTKRIVILDGTLEGEGAEFLKKYAKHMHESAHVFLVYEEKVPAALLKTFEKYADKIEVLSSPKTEKKQEDVFGVARAIAQKQTERAWVLYRDALRNGAVPEAIHGMVFWQLKQLVLKAAPLWKKEEVAAALSQCATLPYRTRSRGGDVEHALEAFILSL